MNKSVEFLAARKARATWDVRAAGLLGEVARRLRVYTSSETHLDTEGTSELITRA